MAKGDLCAHNKLEAFAESGDLRGRDGLRILGKWLESHRLRRMVPTFGAQFSGESGGFRQCWVKTSFDQ